MSWIVLIYCIYPYSIRKLEDVGVHETPRQGHWHITKSEGLSWNKATWDTERETYVQQAIQISISFNSVVSSREAWDFFFPR